MFVEHFKVCHNLISNFVYLSLWHKVATLMHQKSWLHFTVQTAMAKMFYSVDPLGHLHHSGFKYFRLCCKNPVKLWDILSNPSSVFSSTFCRPTLSKASSSWRCSSWCRSSSSKRPRGSTLSRSLDPLRQESSKVSSIFFNWRGLLSGKWHSLKFRPRQPKV